MSQSIWERLLKKDSRWFNDIRFVITKKLFLSSNQKSISKSRIKSAYILRIIAYGIMFMLRVFCYVKKEKKNAISRVP